MNFDILVIGGGGAGLMAALEAAQNGSRVGLFSKTAPKRSQSVMAQGGINAALGNVEEDSIETHIADTLKGGAGLGDPAAAAILCQEAPALISRLDTLGTPFNRTGDAKIDQRSFGGASRKRTCFSSDMTGHAIIHTLYDQCLGCDNLSIYPEQILLELLQDSGRVTGARFFELSSGKIQTVKAKAVILATGGYASIFFNHTTNTPQSSGDGIVAAMNIGADIRNMEFVQFHPTTLKHSSLLVSEAARGAGAYLINCEGTRFVDELTTRDKVTRAIQEEIDAGRDVFLDMRHLDGHVIDHDLQHEARQCRIFEGVDPKTDPVPIKPSAHYTMGGIAVDTRTRVLSGKGVIKGLYACGETACNGAHGANRLGGNSLLDILVFGKVAATEASAYSQDVQIPESDATSDETITPFLEKENRDDFYALRQRFENTMNHHASVVKDARSLTQAQADVTEIKEAFKSCGIADKSLFFNTNLVEYLEFSNMLETALLYLGSALERKESRGSHIRSDFPEPDERFLCNSTAYKEDGHLQFKLI